MTVFTIPTRLSTSVSLAFLPVCKLVKGMGEDQQSPFLCRECFRGGVIIPSSFHFSLSAPPPSLWESVTDVCMGRVQMWEPSLESRCSIRRLHYTPGILESPPVFPSSSASVFLPLTVTQQGAISHSAQRGREELKATEQKKNRQRERRRAVERAEEVGRARVRC